MPAGESPDHQARRALTPRHWETARRSLEGAPRGVVIEVVFLKRT
jgi:hypothetical protein